MQSQRARGNSTFTTASRGSTPTNSGIGVTRGGGSGVNSPSKFQPPVRRTNSPSLAAKVNRFTGPNRPTTPTVVHVFPATARQQVMQEEQQRKAITAATGNSRTASPFSRNNSPTNNSRQQQQQPRSGSPSLFKKLGVSANATNKNNNNNDGTNRNTIVSPFRDVHHQPTSQTFDGRLLYLLKDFSTAVMPTQDQKVQNIASRLRRSGILTDKEMTALETCHSRNANFMGTIERILGDAVDQGVDMRRSVVHQSYEIWRACNEANTYIKTLLETAQSAIGAGKYSRTNLAAASNGFNQSQSAVNANAATARSMSRSASNYPSQQQQQQQMQSPAITATTTSRGATYANSPALQPVKRANSPTNFGDIARPEAPPRQQLAHFDQQYTRRQSSNAVLSRLNSVGNQQQQQQNDFSQAATVDPRNNAGPSNLFIQPPQDFYYQQQQQQQGARRSTSRGGINHNQPPVQVEDAREAQMMFEKLFGPEEGRTRFLHWLSELPENTIQQLHRSLTV